MDKLALYGVGLALAIGMLSAGVWSITEKAYERGVTAERTRIERLQNEARERAVAAARTVRGCYNAGGLWLQTEGRCIMPSNPSADTAGTGR